MVDWCASLGWERSQLVITPFTPLSDVFEVHLLKLTIAPVIFHEEIRVVSTEATNHEHGLKALGERILGGIKLIE